MRRQKEMSEQIKMPLSVSLLLSEMINRLLQEVVKNEDGTTTVTKRNIPFSLEYRLTRNKTSLERDIQRFDNARLVALAKYGEPTPDGKSVMISDPVKSELFKKEMEAILDTEITHSVVKVDPKDFDSITEDLGFSTDALKVLTLYLVDDADLIEDLGMQVNFKTYEPTEEEKKLLNEKKTDVDSLTAEEWVLIQNFRAEKAAKEEPVEKPVEKKTTAKKTTAKKTSTPKKATTAKKTTSKKKEVK